MKQALIVFLLFISLSVSAQKADTFSLKKAINNLNTALLQKDSNTLNKLLTNNLTYGHSNGWIETKHDVIYDLISGKLAYAKIDQAEPVITLQDKIASVRTSADVDVALNGKMIQLKLHILQVWIWRDKRWQLFSRQSVKLN